MDALWIVLQLARRYINTCFVCCVASLASAVAIAETSLLKQGTTDYVACLGKSLPLPQVGFVEKLVYVLSPPGTFGLDIHGNFVTFPDGKLEPMFYLNVWRHQCSHDPKQYALLLRIKSFWGTTSSNQAFLPEHISIEQGGVLFQDSIVLSLSPLQISPSTPPNSPAARTYLVAQSGDKRLDESLALSIRYRGPRSSESDGKTSVHLQLADAPNPNYTGLWWNSEESGWGLNLTHQGDTIFGTIFTYDSDGSPMWLLMSAGQKLPGQESFTGELYRTSGPAYNANPFTPITAANITKVGAMTVSFASPTLRYDVNGVVVTKSIQRFAFTDVGPSACRSTTDISTVVRQGSEYLTNDALWWNPNEAGWGLSVVQQGDIGAAYFATLFTYDLRGKSTWFFMSNGKVFADYVLGDLYSVRGPAFNLPFTSTVSTKVGQLYLYFAYNTESIYRAGICMNTGPCIFKNITPHHFASPPTRCVSNSDRTWK